MVHHAELQGNKAEIADKVVHEIATRLRFLLDVGLNYLAWTAAPTRCRAARRSASAWPARSAAA